MTRVDACGVVPTLVTDRLVLRAFRAEDLDPFAEIVTDPEVMRYLDDGQPISREECWRGVALFLGHWHLRGYGWWAVEHRDDGRFLGRIGIYNPEGWPGVEIGWLLARSAWGRGLATEGARAALAFAFDTVGLDRVISIIDPRNTRSIRVATKLGERYERTIVHDGRPLAVYSLTAGAAGAGAAAATSAASSYERSSSSMRMALPRSTL